MTVPASIRRREAREARERTARQELDWQRYREAMSACGKQAELQLRLQFETRRAP
jgi:hypothetical protein